MTLLRNPARLAALVLGGALLVSCESRSPTSALTSGSSDDTTPPTVTFALSAGTNNTVEIGTPLKVTITATDNRGVTSLNTSMRTAAAVIAADTVALKPAPLTTTRTLVVPIAGLLRGDRVTIRSSAVDAALNVGTDSIIVSIADTTAPKVTLSSVKLNRPGLAIRGGETIDVTVTGSDSSGMRYVGYRILRIRTTDSVQVKADSALPPAGTYPTNLSPAAYSYVVPDTLLVGNYVLLGFGMDRSGLKTNPGPSVAFTIMDGVKPKLTFTAPQPTSKLNVGDSLLVTARITDNIALKSATFWGRSPRGNTSFGTADTVMRYAPLTAPQGTSTFPTGLRDTIIQRYLKPITPVDTLTDSLLVYGEVVDAAGNKDTTRVTIKMVSGPKVTFLAPLAGSQATPNAGLTVTLRATHPTGVTKLGYRMQGEATWPTRFDVSDSAMYGTPLKDVTFSSTKAVPADAPQNGIITITPISVSVDGQEGSSTPMIITVSTSTPPAPRVWQTVPARLETSDSISVTAQGNALTYVGFELRDAANALIKRDSVLQGTPYPSTAVIGLALNLPPTTQGKRFAVVSFAYDQSGRIGYSLPAGSTLPQPNRAQAFVDSTLIVYGRTFALPTGRNGAVADLVVDRGRGNVFLSNLTAGRLEVWQRTSQKFDATGIFVGSQPWGMALSRTALAGDTLYVANSGGTNLSRVFIGTTSVPAMKEDLPNRIVTRISLLYKISEARDPSTGKIRLTLTGPILFSDRPQYVQQAGTGRMYLSTKPTAASGEKGTIRYLDPAAPAPDQRFILAFASPGSDPNSYLVANIDNAYVTPAPANSTVSDMLTLCDHPTGTTAQPTCASSTGGIAATVSALQAAVPTSDVEAAPNLDETSIGLTDTTYASASANGQWIAFGEGNRKPYSRAFLLRDDGSVPGKYSYASPSLNIRDLINNASDQIFGVALDRTGQTLGLHGVETYFASVSQPFTQRLQGKYTTFAQGAGIAFHPNADGTSTPQADRLSFVASNNGTIEMIDIAYFTDRGKLATKFNLYGPLRASLPFAGDDPAVILKLFGLSPNGLVVIDVTATDIKAGP
jgi:hypothetical protein